MTPFIERLNAQYSLADIVKLGVQENLVDEGARIARIAEEMAEHGQDLNSLQTLLEDVEAANLDDLEDDEMEHEANLEALKERLAAQEDGEEDDREEDDINREDDEGYADMDAAEEVAEALTERNDLKYQLDSLGCENADELSELNEGLQEVDLEALTAACLKADQAWEEAWRACNPIISDTPPVA